MTVYCKYCATSLCGVEPEHAEKLGWLSSVRRNAQGLIIFQSRFHWTCPSCLPKEERGE